MGQVIQCEISSDGRAILSLEELSSDDRRMRVYFNEGARKITMADIKKMGQKTGFQRLDRLDYYEVPPLKREKITGFQQINWDLKYQKQILPISFITVTNRNLARLWVEDMALPADFSTKMATQAGSDEIEDEVEVNKQSKYLGVSFTCTHTFASQGLDATRKRRASTSNSSFDVAQIQLEQDYGISSEYSIPEIDQQSPIFNPVADDLIQRFKIEQVSQSLFHGVLPSLESNFVRKQSQDFVAVMHGETIAIFLIKGLRNCMFGTEGGCQVALLYTTKLSCITDSQLLIHIPKTLLYCHQSSLSRGTCTSAKSGGFNLLGDHLSLYGFDHAGSIVKFSLWPEYDNQKREKLWKLHTMSPLTTQALTRSQTSQKLQIESIKYDHSSSGIAVQVAGSESDHLRLYLNYKLVGQQRMPLNSSCLSEDLKYLGGFHVTNTHIKDFQFIPRSPFMQISVVTTEGKMFILQPLILCKVIELILLEDDDKTSVTSKIEDKWRRKVMKQHSGIEHLVVTNQSNPFDLKQLTRSEIISTQVLSVEWGGNCIFDASTEEGKAMVQLLRVAILSEKCIDFVEIKLLHFKRHLKMEADKITSVQLPQDEILLEVLDSHSEPSPEERQLFKEKVWTSKLVAKVINKSKQFEIKELELKSDFTVQQIWTKVLPSQGTGARTQEKPRLNPRGIPYPAKPEPAQPKELDYDVQTSTSAGGTGVLIRNTKKKQYSLFIYESGDKNRYLGFINILDIIQFDDLDRISLLKLGFPLSFCFIGGHSRSIVLACLDSLYYIMFDSVQKKWNVVHRVTNLTGVDVTLINSLHINCWDDGTVVLTTNKTNLHFVQNTFQKFGSHLLESNTSRRILDTVQSKGEDNDWALDEEQAAPKPQKQIQNQIPNIYDQESLQEVQGRCLKNYPLFHPDVLRQLFCQGKVTFVMKILIKLSKALETEYKLLETVKDDPNTKVHISNTMNYTLKDLLREMDSFVEAQVTQMGKEEPAQSAEVSSKPAKKKNEIDDFFGGDDSDEDDGLIDFDDLANLPQKKEDKKKDQKKEEEQPQGRDIETESEFNTVFDTLLHNVAKTRELGGENLIDFLFVFKQLFAKDFFSDPMATVLLREIFFDSEPINREEVMKLFEVQEAKQDTEIVRKLENHEIYAQMYGETNNGPNLTEYQQKNQGDLRKLKPWTSRMCALALFSKNQDVIVDELSNRFALEENGNWDLIKTLCMPVWMKESYKLRQIVECIAVVAYKDAGDLNLKKVGDGSQPISQAEQTSLWYLLMNKKSVLITLYEREKSSGGDKVASLLSQDFSIPRWSKAAAKNAMVLRQKQRYLLSATFFILAGDMASALQIIRQSMRDPVLAILTCRMLELQQPQNEEIKKTLESLYKEFFIERGEQKGDVYLKSIGLWSLQKYVEAVNSLQIAVEEETPNNSYKIKSQKGSLVESIFDCSADEFNIKIAENQQNLNSSDGYLPIPSKTIGYELQVMISNLKKAHQVTHALKAVESNYGADTADIFNDFFGGPSTAQATQNQKSNDKEKVQLNIDSSAILNNLMLVALENSDTFSGLFLLRENRDLIQPTNTYQVHLISNLVRSVLKDQIEEVRENPTYLAPADTLRSQLISVLDFTFGQDSDPFKLDKTASDFQILRNRLQREGEMFIIRKLQQLQGQYSNESGSNVLARYELEFRIESLTQSLAYLKRIPDVGGQLTIPRHFCTDKAILNRVYEQTLKFKDILNTFTDNPFLENDGRWQLESNLKKWEAIILEMEQHVDCLIIWDHYEKDQRDEGQVKDSVHIDQLEIQFYTKKEESKEVAPESGKKEKPKASDPFDDLMGGDDSDDGMDLMDFDLDSPPRNVKQVPEFKTHKNEPQLKRTPSKFRIHPEQIEESLEIVKQCEFDILKLKQKIKMSLIMHLSLIVLSTHLSKFYISKDILTSHDFRSVTDISGAQVNSLEDEIRNLKFDILRENSSLSKEQLAHLMSSKKRIEEFNNNVTFSNLKTFIQKFKCSIEKKNQCLKDILMPQDQDKVSDQEISDLKFQIVDEEADTIQDSPFFEKWELAILRGEDKVQQILSEEPAEGRNLKEQHGILSKEGQLTTQTFLFLRTWLKFILINQTKEILEDSFLANPSLNLKSDRLQSSFYVQATDPTRVDIDASISLFSIPGDLAKSESGQVEEAQILMSKSDLTKDFQDLQSSLLKHNFVGVDLVQKFRRAARQLEDECTIQFQTQLSVLQRRYLAIHLTKINQSQVLRPLLLCYWFKSQEKLQEFAKEFQLSSKYSKPLYDQYLCHLAQSYTVKTEQSEKEEGIVFPPKIRKTETKNAKGKPIVQDIASRDTATRQLLNSIQGNGVELFKQRGEQISDFAFDNSDFTNNIAIGLMASGIREIPGLNTLLFRNRVENGLQLIDEENLKWEECLHRYDVIEPLMYQGATTSSSRHPEILPSKDDSIISIVDSLYSSKTIFSRTRPLNRLGHQFLCSEPSPPIYWNGEQSEKMMQHISKLDITHEDYTFPIESHPVLPLYVTGNRRGILCTWMFGQQADKSLYQFFPEFDPRYADPKKACVKKIMFNRSGDKIMSNNMEGSFSIYKFDCQVKQLRKVPIFSLYESVDTRVTDFDLVNGDNVICTISQKSKSVKLFDTLLPYSFGKQAQVMEFKLPNTNSCGNLIVCNQRTQTLYTFNGRTGAMTELDLRMNCNVVNQVQLSQSHEITAACLNLAQDSLVTGYKDGNLQIHSLAPTLTLRDKIEAFPFDFRSKKGTVQKVKVNPKTGGLFACSQAGILKLMRTSV